MRILEWLVLLPLWRRVIGDAKWHVPAAVGTGVAWVVIIIIVAIASSSGGDDESDEAVSGMETPTTAATAAPTEEPEPTPEPTVEPIPTEAQGPTGPALEILNTSSRTDSVDSFHVVGEVLNNSDSYTEFVEVVGAFFNAAGDVVASDSTFTILELVAPGELAPFDLLVIDGATLGITDFQLQVQGDATSSRPVPGLSIQGETSNVDIIDSFHVVGQVINESSKPYDFVEIIGTFYDANGTVVAADFTFTELDVVPAGGSSPFDLLVIDGGTYGIASYTLSVRGSPIN